MLLDVESGFLGPETFQNRKQNHTSEMLSSKSSRSGRLQQEYLVLSYPRGKN
jgi:hypothetical protein